MTQSVPAGFAPDRELVGTHALVVDDDADLLELEEILLRSFGIEVTVAHSGDEAFRLFEAVRPGVLVSDIQMPDGDGLDLIRRIRALAPERGGHTPAIAISGAASLEASLDAGFHFHFQKPVAAQPLIDAIRSFVHDEAPGPQTWTVEVDDSTITLRVEGALTSGDMRAIASALVPMLVDAAAPVEIVSDLSRLTSFTPGVVSVAHVAMWNVRTKMRAVQVIGGSLLARAASRSLCQMLGVPCTFADDRAT